MPAAEIRRMAMEDKEKVQRFFDLMGERSASFFNVNHGNEKRTMRFFDDGKKDHIFWVIEVNDEIAALAFIWSFDRCVPWYGVAVADKYQRMGYGTAITEYVLNYLESNGYGGLLLETAQNNICGQKLYEKCGFERIGVHQSGEYLYIRRFNHSV